MADDGKPQGDDRGPMDDDFDPWADLEADAASDLGGGFSLSDDDLSLDAGLDASLDIGAAPDGAVADDAVVDAWLREATDNPSEPASLSVFVPEDPAESADPTEPPALGEAAGWPHDPAAIEIGTGQSSVTSASDIDVLELLEAESPAPAAGDVVFDAAGHDEAAEPVETVAFAATDGDGDHGEAHVIDFGTAAAGMATLTAAAEAVTVAPAAVRPRRKRGLLGQLLGVLLGGLLAIPLVLGILIGLMWLGWKDTLGIRQWMPRQFAFLLPESRPAVAFGGAGGPSVVAVQPLDELPPEPSALEPPAESGAKMAADSGTGEPPVDGVAAAVAERSVATTAEPLVAAAAAEPEPEVPQPDAAAAGHVEPAPPPIVAETEVVESAPAAGDLAAIVSRPALPAEPAVASSAAAVVDPSPLEPPLDLGGLETAVEAAAAALDEVKAAPDPADPVRKVRLVKWYRQLALVAQELAAVEHRAAESGHPLAEPPAPAVDLGEGLLSMPEVRGDLPRLARNWLTYSRREVDGVVLPATFAGGRRVGPYWCSRVTIVEAGDTTRELTVISRAEPVAVPGDAIMVMGLVMDGGVLWATDLRAAAGHGPEGEPDPFGQPGP